MLKFSVRNVFRKKSVAILASSGIGIGLMLMFVLGSFNAGVEAQFRENFSEVLGQVEIQPDTTQDVLLDPTVLTNLTASSVGPDIERYNVLVTLPLVPRQNEFKNPGTISIRGVNQSVDASYNGPTANLEQGRAFTPGSREAIVDSRLLEAANFSVALGANITVDLNISPAVDDLVNLTIVGVYTQADSGAPSFVPRTYYLYIDLETTWELLDQAGFASNGYSQIDLQFPATDNEQTDAYIEEIDALSQQGALGDVPLAVFSLGQFQGAISETFGIFDTFVTVIGLITALAGGTGIVVSQLMSVTSRMKEFAILKATGWKNRHIFQNIVYESLTLSFVGAAIGLGLGFGLITLFASSPGPFSTIQALVTPMLVFEILAFAFGVGLVGGLYPGFKAAKVRPVRVLKGE